MNMVKIVLKLIIGLIFGVLSMFMLVPAFAAFTDTDVGTGSAWVPWLVALLGTLLGVFAPTLRRAFGRGFLLLGACIFLLPLSMLLLSGRVTSDMVGSADNEAAVAVGAGIAGVLMTGASAFIGFFLGAVFLIIGLVLALGGRRDVVVVKQ